MRKMTNGGGKRDKTGSMKKGTDVKEKREGFFLILLPIFCVQTPEGQSCKEKNQTC